MSVLGRFDKYVCEKCDSVFDYADVLFVQNPYLMDTVIYICPHCKRDTNLFPKCEIDGCNNAWSFILADNDGHRKYVCFCHTDEVVEKVDKK